MATLPSLHQTTNVLKPALSAWIATHPYRQRARPMDVSTVMAHAYDYKQHGTDVLLYWYAQVRQLGEHIFLWGPDIGMSPSRFIAEAIGWDMVVLAAEDALWTQGDGLVVMAYGDDAYPPMRQRVHFWVAPAYRHPRTTQALVHTVLTAYFTRYAVLWGITPATRHLALRAVRRWGFREVGRLPQSEHDGGYQVDGVISALTRDEWTMGEQA